VAEVADGAFVSRERVYQIRGPLRKGCVDTAFQHRPSIAQFSRSKKPSRRAENSSKPGCAGRVSFEDFWPCQHKT